MMKGQKGITLVALIITIIVMLILVAVSVSIALNGGLISKAREAGDKWNNVDDNINNVHNVVNVTIDGQTYTGIDNIVNNTAE